MKYLSSFIVFIALLFYILPNSAYDSSFDKKDSERSPVLPVEKSVIDSYNGVPIYYNGNMSNTFGRNLTEEGYNLGLKWQCVEFVKRYYYDRFNHEMPDSYGHARDFYDSNIKSGWNKSRKLNQFENGNKQTPKEEMILVFDQNDENPYGHIGIISKVGKNQITIAQQNWGSHTRMNLPLIRKENLYFIDHPDILGWLSL